MINWVHKRNVLADIEMNNGIGMSICGQFLKGEVFISELGEVHEVRSKTHFADIEYYRKPKGSKLEHPLTVRVSFDTLDSLKREAKESNLTVSQLVNCILETRAEGIS